VKHPPSAEIGDGRQTEALGNAVPRFIDMNDGGSIGSKRQDWPSGLYFIMAGVIIVRVLKDLGRERLFDSSHTTRALVVKPGRTD